MYRCERLTNKKLPSLKEINEKRLLFNSLNQDFFTSYQSKNLFHKMILINNVKLLNYKNKYVGYIWCEKVQRRHYVINSLGFSESTHFIDGATHLIKSFKLNNILSYDCEKNDFNFLILEKIGFMKEQGTIELIREVREEESLYFEQDISFEKFERGKHEKIRCELQNTIFKNDNRQPLTLEDIYYDLQQDYYIEQGSVFIKYKNNYIGYGQVIIDEGLPTIVNFGIVESFRNKGCGKLLLKYLINLMYEMNCPKVKIKVYTENYAALNLYINTGFVKVKEYYRWNYLV